MKNINIKKVVNFLLYQAIWLACVFGGPLGILLGLILIVFHLYISPLRKLDLRLICILVLAGVVIDGCLQMVGVISFFPVRVPIPLWLATIWAGLAILPHHSLSWLKNKQALSAILAAIAGPLAYLAGVQAGVAEFGVPVSLALLIYALIWAVLWPLVMNYAHRILHDDELVGNER